MIFRIEESTWRLFRLYFEEETLDNNFLCCFCKSSKKKISKQDHLLLNSSLYEIALALLCIIIQEWNQFSDFYQILYSSILMTPLIFLILFSTKHSKDIFYKLFPKSKAHKHDEIEEEKAISHISHAQLNFNKELKVLFTFFIGFGAFILALSRILNLTNNQARNVLISIGITFAADSLIIRNIFIFIYALIRAYCFKHNLIKNKAEDAIHMLMGNMSKLYYI